MNSDKAYILGLVVGGGVFTNDASSFSIHLPYKQWGDIAQNPSRAGQITRDIMGVVKPMMKAIYGIEVSFLPPSKEWVIVCEGNLTPLNNDLLSYKITPKGEIKRHVSIQNIVTDLIDDNLKRRFVAGLADTIGSTTKSHRRFTDDIQIISFEISGFNFNFVCELCRLLHTIKCYPDQVLWNHPNFHSSQNPYYISWKKGFKLRVKLDQYGKFGAFAFRTKAESAKENRDLQSNSTSASPCDERNINVKSSCVHMDESSAILPEKIRGGHYLHNKHVCAVLGCEYAPYEQINELIKNASDYVNPFPIICKDTITNINSIIKSDSLYANRIYSNTKVDIEYYYNLYRSNKNLLIYGSSNDDGYPLDIIMQAIAFLIASEQGKLNGFRIKGSYLDILEESFENKAQYDIFIQKPEIPTPIIIKNKEYAVLIGSENSKIYKKLLSIDPENKYKLIVRKIQESDFAK